MRSRLYHLLVGVQDSEGVKHGATSSTALAETSLPLFQIEERERRMYLISLRYRV